MFVLAIGRAPTVARTSLRQRPIATVAIRPSPKVRFSQSARVHPMIHGEGRERVLPESVWRRRVVFFPNPEEHSSHLSSGRGLCLRRSRVQLSCILQSPVAFRCTRQSRVPYGGQGAGDDRTQTIFISCCSAPRVHLPMHAPMCLRVYRAALVQLSGPPAEQIQCTVETRQRLCIAYVRACIGPKPNLQTPLVRHLLCPLLLAP